LFVLASLGTWATLVGGRCSECLKWHLRSTVTMNPTGFATALACDPGHYDEDGKFVPGPECNTLTIYGRCSRGHKIVEAIPAR
jgi:hypothetical protein